MTPANEQHYRQMQAHLAHLIGRRRMIEMMISNIVDDINALKRFDHEEANGGRTTERLEDARHDGGREGQGGDHLALPPVRTE